MDALPLKPFDCMTDDDYASIGLMCGLEVHQQILTRRKLFCRCPAGHYSPDYDAEVLRHMRPTLSEMGEYDGTALMEKKTRKEIVYRLHHATVCTYEFDDTPPFPIDDEAVDIALGLSMLLGLNLVNELHVARKQYLDGSIPTGFQRTTLFGVDGSLPYGGRRIGVRQLSLEEDSCREVSDRGHERVYLTDRLGMPLIEVVTEPEMRTPQETADVCRVISKLCRSTQKVRRGYGATRQDVNVSVCGGTRIEIKGVPQIWRIPRLIYNEASRQVAILRIRDELNRRNVDADHLAVAVERVTDLVGTTRFAPLRNALDRGHEVIAVRLGGFAGLLNTPTQEHTTFAKEFADRVRVIACLSELPNIVHSDAASDSLTAGTWQGVRRRVRAGDDDAVLVVWGEQRDTATAADEIVNRAREATIGVPGDTRQAYKDGTNGFERVLPGPERMYPDTDLPPIAITLDRVERVRSVLPRPVWETEATLRSAGMTDRDAEELCMSPRIGMIMRLLDSSELDGRFLGVLLGQRVKAWRRAGLEPERLTDEAWEALIDANATGRLAREGVTWLVEHLLRLQHDAPRISAGDVRGALDELGIRPIDETKLIGHLDRAIAATQRHRYATTEKLERSIMGRVMRDLVGRVAGRRLSEILHERLRERPSVEITVERSVGEQVDA